MTESVKQLFFIAVSITAHIWVLNRFFGSFFERKRLSFFAFFPWFLLCVSQVLMLCLPQKPSILFALANVLLTLLIVTYGYESSGAGPEKYFLLAILYAVWVLTELTLYYLLDIFPLDWESTKVIGTVSSSILMMTFSYVVSVLWDKKYMEQVPRRFLFALLLIPVGSIYIMFVQYRLVDNYLLSTGVVGILLLFNMITFDVYTKISRFFFRAKENAVHAEQLSLISQNMEEQKKLMESFHEEKHNLINELTALRAGINQENSAETVQSLDKIVNGYHNMENISSSGNDTVDAIINAKYATARTYGISFGLHISVPEKLAIEQRDLGVVIGNALDNAVTAVKECVSTERGIEISMSVKKNAWIMVMKNPYVHMIRRNRNGEILSTKPEKEQHGYGLRSIRRIARAYDGDVIIETDGGWFSLTVVLNFSEF